MVRPFTRQQVHVPGILRKLRAKDVSTVGKARNRFCEDFEENLRSLSDSTYDMAEFELVGRNFEKFCVSFKNYKAASSLNSCNLFP